MDNKYVFALVGGVFLFLWFYVGNMEYFGGAFVGGYLFSAVLVMALGGGADGGDDVVSAITGSITGFVGTYVGLLIAVAVASIANDFIAQDGFDLDGLIRNLGTVLASGILVSAARACISKSG